MSVDPLEKMLTYDEQYPNGDDGTVGASPPDRIDPKLAELLNGLREITGADAEQAGAPAHLAVVLDEVVTFIGRFMAMTPAQLDAVALFVAHTHAVDDLEVVAYLFVTSAEKRCGKTLLLDLLERLVLRGRATTNISPAALYRMIEDQRPTLLFDEVDNIFPTRGKNADPSKSDLIGLINAGFRRGRPAFRMGGANMRTLEEFDPFGPKVLAGIGRCLPDTTEDRTVPIVIPRKPRALTKERYRIRIHESEASAVAERIALAVSGIDLKDKWPALPPELNDRQQDIWEPLLAVADAAGGDWPSRARDAAVVLHKQADPTESLGVKLLTDIKTVFTTDKMLTKELVEALNGLDESPWSGWRADKGISSVQLVNRLRDFGIRSKPIRSGSDRGRGFEIDQFLDAFDSYIDDTVDTVDDDASAQVIGVNDGDDVGVDAGVDGASPDGVNGRVNTPSSSGDDAPDLPVSGIVNTVNTVSADQPNVDPDAFDGDLFGAEL